MNREIKFRAWSTLDNTMELLKSSDTLDTLQDARHWKVMQFTGLKDKNGKEIYEGDIVKANNKKGQVRYNTPRFEVEGFYESSFDDPSDAFSEAVVEVIGNVYENKELLQ